MSKFNSKTKKRMPTAINEMGESAFELTAKEELVSTVLTSFLQKSYYETEKKIVSRLQKAADKVDPEFLAKLAIYARRDAHMRSTTHLLAGEVGKRVSGKEWGSRFFQKIAMRPDDMAEIVGYWISMVRDGSEAMKLPNALKKGFRSKLESMDSYLFDKYKMNHKNVSMIDLINLFHPNPNVNTNQFVKVKCKDLRDALLSSKRSGAKTRAKQINKHGYIEISIIEALVYGLKFERVDGSKILEQTMSEAGKDVSSNTELKEAKAKAIKSVLNENKDGMPYFNLLRNLKNILINTPEEVPEACRQLVIKEKIQGAKILPFRFLSAYKEIESYVKGTRTYSKIQFEFSDNQTRGLNTSGYADMILNALNTAINISCENIVKLKGNTAILIDHSGSVRGDSGGASLTSKFSNTTISQIGNLFGAMLMQGQDNVYVGLFGDKLIRYDKIDRDGGILANANTMYDNGRNCGDGTEQGMYDFINDAIANKVRVDNLVIFSDMVIGREWWYGLKQGTHSGSFQSLFKTFKKMNPTCNVLTINIHQTSGKTVFDKSLGVTQVSGWSERIFDQLKTATEGYKALIKEIEAIKL